MKKIVLCMFALLAICSTAYGDNSITIQAISLPQNAEADLVVGFSFDDQKQFTSYSFKIQLPEGVEFVADGEDAAYELGDCYDAKKAPTISPNLLSNNLVSVGGMSSVAFTKSSGVLLTLKIKLTSTSTLGVGTTVQGTLSDAIIVTTGLAKVSVDGSSFNITIAEPADFRTVLDETSTTAPEAATNVDVRVKRTIKANTWSTICLPFAMTETQVTSAFGNGVVLGDFTAWSSEEDDEENITSISIEFTEVKAIVANHPYIIKVSEALSDFTVDGVSIEPEGEPSVQVGKKKAERGYFTGTYVADTTVPQFNLFLSGGKFYYSSGKTKMKGYRGYFELADVLTEVEENAGARAFISFNAGDGTTKILNADFLRTKTGKVFSVTGRYMGENVDMKSLPKGIYIVDGVKIIND